MNQKEIWDDLVGDAWVRNADVIDAHGAPFGGAAMDGLEPLEGATVLDVGCGTGGTTFELAQRGAAKVIGVDLSERMLAHARARTPSEHADRITFEVGDVTTMSVPEPFDAAFSRFGVMFFDDPVAGFAHLRHLVRPAGRLGFCAWRDPFVNPWMSLAVMASIPVLGPPEMPGPDEPGPFSLSSAERVHEVLEAAGWRDVTVEELSISAPHPAGDSDAVAAMVLEQVPPLAAGLSRSPERATELHTAVADAFRPHERDGRVTLEAAALIVGAGG